jgi:Ca-activated chloride channel family protein
MAAKEDRVMRTATAPFPVSPCVFVVGAVVAPLFAPSLSLAEYAMIRGIPITQGQMRVAKSDFQEIERATPTATDQFILKETRVEMEVSGVLARVRVDHVFQNPHAARLEALYVFPLPENAAVDRYWFQVGEQVVRGVVKEREQARQQYERARDEGRKAALLEQDRADIFSQSVANIPPNGTVTVHIEYVHPVQIDGDRYVLRFPMVVGPRYIPGQPLSRPSVGRGWAADTDQVPDASRITPRPLPPGMRNGNDVQISIKLDAGMPIQEITGVSHELEVKTKSDTTAVVSLKDQTTIANKDFLVEYRLAGDDTVIASLAHRGEADGYFALVLQPKWQTETAELTPRDVILLLDTSGSMSGTAISQLRVFAQHVLDHVNPQDSIHVVSFSNRPRKMSPRPVSATPENTAAADQFIRNLRSGGGTEMLSGLQAALGASPAEPNRVRYLVLVTDALVGNDDSILGYLKRPEFSDVRVFPVAMGGAPNHYLISRAAELSRGFAMQVANQDNAAEIADRLGEKISSPYMTDLEIDFGGLQVCDVLPQPLPDLYAGQPLVVLGRYDQPGQANLTLRANLQGQAIESVLPVALPENEPEHDCLGPLWARQRIRHIWNRDLGQETSQGRVEITRLGLTHQLVTRYTSFIAVEEELPEQVSGELLTQQVQPMLPEGMTEDALGTIPQQKANPVIAPRSSPNSTPQDAVAYGDTVPASPPSYGPTPGPSSGGGGAGGGSGGAGGGGGGSVEWLFLAGLGALGAGRLLGRRRNGRRSDDDSRSRRS